MAVNSSTEVLKNIENRQFKTPSISKFRGPFQATQLYKDVIKYLKQNVGRKRRRVKMLTYDNCFTGSDAVTIVLERLNFHSDAFITAITRDKATKLCELLMKQRVFAPVGSKRRCTESEFEDSSTRFFRFTNCYLLEKSSLEEEEGTPLDDDSEETTSSKTDSSAENEEDDDDDDDDDSTETEEDHSGESGITLSNSSVSSSRHSFIVQEIMDITGTWKRYSSGSLRRKFTPARFRSSLSLPDSAGLAEEEEELVTGGKPLQPAEEEEIWREVALAQLLTLVDIPVLDPILSYDHTSQAAIAKDMAFSNLAFKRVESISSLFTDKTDLWLEAATDCLECLPHGFDILDRSLSEETELTQKLRMYQSIADHYRSQKEPLLPSSFSDMHIALLNLLMQGRRDVVLRCVQLSLLLLPLGMRLELTHLLRFLKVAAEDNNLKLTATDDSNRRVVEKTFTPAILRHKVLNPHQCAQLILFMMDNADKIAHCPPDIEELALARIDEATVGMARPIKEITFCRRVGAGEYHKQQKECTESAIIELMNSIIDDCKIPLKEKKQRLKQFKTAYPELYKMHFVDIL